jgi:hypothetical protein
MVKTLFGKMGERASGQNYIAEEHADPKIPTTYISAAYSLYSRHYGPLDKHRPAA